MSAVMTRSAPPAKSNRSSATSWLSQHLDKLPTLAALVIFLGMIVYGEVAYGRILQYSTLSNLLINNAHLIILGVGLTS